MTNLGDVDMSDFEKLADSFEFENKQYVKMIEKENQCILSLQSQIEANKEKIQRLECDISRMDEDTMRLHKQFVQSKETLKNLKDTYNVMMDHEMALSKQLESLKIKSEEERQLYQEQVSNYSKIKDDYMRKYESFPLAIELRKKKERLSEKQRETTEIESVITNLQEKIREKEAVLDSKVFSRMIIKIARLKLSTLQTEREIDKCLVDKTSLLEQLKQIQGTQQPREVVEVSEISPLKPQAYRHTMTSSPQQRSQKDNDKTKIDGEEQFGEDIEKNSNELITSLENKLQSEKNNGIRDPEESNDEVTKSDSINFLSSDEGKTACVRLQALKMPKSDILPGRSDNDQPFSSQKSTAVSAIKRKDFSSHISEITKRIPPLPQAQPIQKAVHKIPSFKPIQRFKIPSKEQTSTDVQATALSMPKATTVPQKITIPTFTRSMLSVPKLNVPTFSLNGERYKTTTVPLKEPASSRPHQNDDKRRQQKPYASATTSMTFSFPKFAESSRSLNSYTASASKSSEQQTINLKNCSFGGKNSPAPLNSIQFNQNDKSNAAKTTVLTHQPSALKHSKFERPTNGIHITEQKRQRHLHKQLNKESQGFGCSLNSVLADDKMNVPPLKPSAVIDSMKPASRPAQMVTIPKSLPDGNSAVNMSRPLLPPPPPPLPTFSSPIQQYSGKQSSPSSFTMGSIFKPIREDDSSSPTAFSLINLGSGGTSNNSNQGTPLLSFGGSNSDVGNDQEERPTSLFNLFNTQSEDELEAKEKMMPFNFRSFDNESDTPRDSDEKGSFFNFSRGAADNSGDAGGSGGFFNFGKDDDPGQKETLFNLF